MYILGIIYTLDIACILIKYVHRFKKNKKGKMLGLWYM